MSTLSDLASQSTLSLPITTNLNINQYLTLFLTDTLPRLWPLWLIPLLVIILQITLRIRRHLKLARSGIRDIDRMQGAEFENYLDWLFKKLGYKSATIGNTGDFGGDLLLERDGKKIVIQAKRYDQTVGVEAIQQTVAAKGYYETDRAIVVTNSYFTRAAKELASANQVELWDRTMLINQITHAKNN